MTHKSRTRRIIALRAFYALVLGLSSLLLPTSSSAQFIGYESPQTDAQAFSSTCTGAVQDFTAVANLGQTQHYVSIAPQITVTNALVRIIGQDANGNNFTISDTLFTTGLASANPTVSGSGYYPKIIIRVICNGGTFILSYSGTSATSNVLTGSYLQAQVDKAIFQQIPENATLVGPQFITPAGSSFGTLVFQYLTASIAGSSLSVSCNANGVLSSYVNFTYALANTTAIQTFHVPPNSCPLMTVAYSTGSGGAGTASLDYLFPLPGIGLTSTPVHITGTTATVVKAGPGMVQAVIVGTPVTGTISLFDLVPASCTGTPATSIVAVLNETATNAPASIPFGGAVFSNGICAKASVAGDFTVVSQ